MDHLLAYSRRLIAAAQAPSGAYPACENFPAYQGYSWFRDGSFIADAMSAVGEADSATAFFNWGGAVIERHQAIIEAAVAGARTGHPLPDEQMLPTRFTFAGEPGGDDWWDFQLDGYGTFLWALAAHCRRHDLDLGGWSTAINHLVDYLVASWERPCFDWWEEHSEAVHLSTLGCIAAGLAAVAGVLAPERAAAAVQAQAAIRERMLGALHEGHLVKWIGSTAVDGSLAALLAPLGVIEASSAIGQATLAALEAQLVKDGGVYRFLDDSFYGGGRWPLLTCFLGLAKLAAGDREGAVDCLKWAVGTASPAGDLPEQVDGQLLVPDRRQEWLERWGPVASPLLWSHAMVLRLAVELGQS